MRMLFLAAAAVSAMAITTAASPARADIVGITPGVDLSIAGPFTINLFDGSSYTFSTFPYDPSDGRYRTVALATTGSATGYGGGFIGNGTDFTSYSAGSATPGNNFGGDFITAPTPRPIDYSLTDTYVALRFGTVGAFYYGYGEVAGTTLQRFAYNDVANGSITTGEAITAPLPAAVPEPASWALLTAGLGLMGLLRRRRTTADSTLL